MRIGTREMLLIVRAPRWSTQFELVCAHCRYMKEFRKTIKVCNTFCNFIRMWVLSYKVLSLIYDRFEELTFYMQHTAIWFLSKSILSIIALPIDVVKIEFKID